MSTREQVLQKDNHKNMGKGDRVGLQGKVYGLKKKKKKRERERKS